MIVAVIVILTMITMITTMILILTFAIHPVSMTRFPLSRFSPGAGLLRNPFVHRWRLRLSRGWVRKDGNLVTETGCTHGSFLSLSLYSYIYMYIYIYIYICRCVYIYIYTYTYIHSNIVH